MTTHTILNGDCLEELFKIPSQSIELVITDPPFNIGKKYNSYTDSRTKSDYLQWCVDWLFEIGRVLKPGGALYLFNYPENNVELKKVLDGIMTFKRWCTWHYPTNTGMSPTNYTRSQYSILFYVKGGKIPRVFNKDDIAEPYKNPTDKRIKALIAAGKKGRTPYDVFIFNQVKNVSKDKTDHPCQIPVDLLQIFVKASSNPGDWILDPFGGSFSTAVAAKRWGRNSINIEIDSHYCEIGRERLNKTIPYPPFE